VREQKFNLQARRLDVFFAEKFRAFLDRFEDGHATNLVLILRIQSLFDGIVFVVVVDQYAGLINDIIANGQPHN